MARHMSARRCLLLLLPALLGPGSVLFAAESDPWWDVAWTARRLVDIKPTGANVQGAETGVVEFRTLGRLAAGGQDLRVVADGQPLQMKVLYAGSDDSAVVAFKMPRGAKRYFLYFGNLKAPKLTVPWEPERGLWLETRKYTGGPCDNWDQMRKMVELSGPSFGAGPVRQVFQGYNSFSSAMRYVSVYHGWLACPEDGEYTFATSSKDASFLFLDGKLVTSFPGYHPPANHARHTGKVTLGRGVKKFEYYHVNGGADGMAAAYWQLPSGKRFVPLPPDAFTPVAQGRAGPLEVRGETVGDFDAEPAGEAYVGERPLLRYRFRLTTPPGLREVTWDFGDGQSAAGPDVSHVYFRESVFRVSAKATVKGQAVQTAARVSVHINFDRQTESNKDDPQTYLEEARRYRWETLDLTSLEAASSFYFMREDVEGQIATARALVGRPETPDGLYFEQAMRLQALLREQRKDPDAAMAVLHAAEDRVKNDKNMRAKILREVGDVYYFHKHDLDHALLEYDKVVGRYTGLEDNIVRVTKIRIGDIMRERGNYEKAATNYTEADRLRLDKWAPDQLPVRIGVLIHATEDYLRRGDAAEARKWVEIWEWEFPLERLRGQSTVLRARIALLEKNPSEAQKQLEALVRVNPESQYVGEALFMLADLAVQARDLPKALALLKELIDKHPDSERVSDAEEKLKALEAAARPKPDKTGPKAGGKKG